jgi:hypothetical protein
MGDVFDEFDVTKVRNALTVTYDSVVDSVIAGGGETRACHGEP